MKPPLNVFSETLLQPTNCLVCPRSCGADRTANLLGYCNASDGIEVASVCIHKGEEPAIMGDAGICNVFFRSCNMQCIYCQNQEISKNSGTSSFRIITLNEVVEEICHCLDQGCKAVGFVSPSHMVPQMLQIINALHEKGRLPILVYNSNGYDKVEVLKELEGVIDVYLPDFKYADATLAHDLSETGDYVDFARLALREMYRQKGSPLHLDDSGQAISGLIVRHLVLPGYIENSKKVLEFIAHELSPGVHLSLMSQYHPMPHVSHHPSLGRLLMPEEYDEILGEMERLGLVKGWIQELDSSTHYLPDFSHSHPFEIEHNNNLVPV